MPEGLISMSPASNFRWSARGKCHQPVSRSSKEPFIETKLILSLNKPICSLNGLDNLKQLGLVLPDIGDELIHEDVLFNYQVIIRPKCRDFTGERMEVGLVYDIPVMIR